MPVVVAAAAVGFVLIAVAFVEVPSTSLPRRITAAELQCTLSDVGPNFRVDYTQNLTPQPEDRWVQGNAIYFSNNTGPETQVGCAVFTFNGRTDRDADFARRRSYIMQSGSYVEPQPPSVGEASFYYEYGAGSSYGVEFLRGNFAVLIFVFSSAGFDFYPFTSHLAQRLAAK